MVDETASLFGSGPIEQKGPDVFYEPGAFRGVYTLEDLRRTLPLEHKTCVMYGKTLAVPRLECWFGDRAYRFGGRIEQPKPWALVAIDLRERVEARAGERFSSCFVNFYRDGQDTIGWHADDDDWIGPVIASVTFGAARRFVMRQKVDALDERTAQERRARAIKLEWTLGDGDLFVMRAGVQQAWQHTVPRQAAPIGPRINFTFRQTSEGR